MTRASKPRTLGDPKRAFDVAMSSTGLVVLSPVLFLVAAAIWATDKGPVLFSQERVGLGDRTFQIHKFRTMRNGQRGALVTSADDNRITPIGKVLRAAKLDELPQLFDVLRGDMSLVGPRPEVRRYVECWGDEAKAEILSVRPGITDPASVVFRNEQDELAAAEDPDRHYVEVILPKKVAMYREYVRNRTFIGDLKIIMSTLLAVIRG